MDGTELTAMDGEGAQPDGDAAAELAILDGLDDELDPDLDGSPAAPPDPALSGDDPPASAKELAMLRSELDEARTALDAERAARRAAVERYRATLLRAEPQLPAELVEGETLETLDVSVEAARRAVAQIREQLAQEASESAARGFPAGAPERRGPNLSGMTPAEKIAYGLELRPGG